MSENKTPYRVLARKYRPQNFDDLIGQEALVRTLKNAIDSGRIAHAYMLTGIRGVGKTTTARIIAKALNYTGPDGTAGPTTGRTDDCDTCRAIAEDRHPDVLEMDAASRTGIDDIREILDGVRYAPTSARYKIYIIDEVHMLSKNAFNALLKTLEEPPAHVKFIFATTEIRKVPVTVLSRCQRFDLRRIEADTLAAYYKTICDREQVTAEEAGLALIARAADGSVRDGLSLLDQAISLGDGGVTAAQIKDMLGLADRGLVLDLMEHAVTGNCPAALDIMEDLYRKGADPSVIVNDLLDMVHMLTRLRAAPNARGGGAVMPGDNQERARVLSEKLSMPTLGRAWQIVLKGLGEVAMAPDAQKAAEMVLIRLSYAADLPDPAELIKKIKGQPANAAPVPPAGGGGGGTAYAASQGNVALASEPLSQPAVQPVTAIQTLDDVVAALQQGGHMTLASQVYLYVHLVKLADGQIEFRPAEMAPPRLAQDLGQALRTVTDKRWMLSVSSKPGAPTLDEQARARETQKLDEVRAVPLVAEILRIFPGAEIKTVHSPEKD